MTGGNVGYIPQRVVDSLHSGDSGGIVRWHHHRVCMTVVSGRELQPLSFQFWFTIRTWHIRFCLCNKAFLITQQWTPWRQVKNLLEPRRSQEYMHTSRERYTYIKGRKYIHTSKENILSFTKRKYTHTSKEGNIHIHETEETYQGIIRRKYIHTSKEESICKCISKVENIYTHTFRKIYTYFKRRKERRNLQRTKTVTESPHTPNAIWQQIRPWKGFLMVTHTRPEKITVAITIQGKIYWL